MHVQIISFNINGYKSKNVKLLSLHMDPFQTWYIILQSCLSNDFIHFFFAAQETEHACIWCECYASLHLNDVNCMELGV